MNPLAAAGVLLALVAVSTAAGLLWRARTGRARAAAGDERVHPHEVGAEPAGFGGRATLLQFSTEYCSPCRSTARVLGSAAAARRGVSHVEVDLADRPELAGRFSVLQTPTTLVLDGHGAVRARISGAARPADVASVLDRLLGSDHVPA
ncbi:TlpA family protein disulfide reductase [Leifsonia sp. AG29]|uniref:TlpA family protein disulfide reductase n=1 Tax=Leifsonia sp. AG29 TaxID=2598860 RepID=UPI00131D93D6|nr:thioredoxin family protein [Leifsonia sp. AG29]